MKTCCKCGGEFNQDAHAVIRHTVCPKCRVSRVYVPAIDRKLEGIPLSNREKQICKLIALAKSNKQIAFELSLAEGTIKEYLNRIFRKLDCSNRGELMLYVLHADSLRIDE